MTDFKPQVDPWDLMVEHNKRIQILEKHVSDLARLCEQLSNANLQNVRSHGLNTQSIDALTRAHEENLRLVMDLAGKLNTAEENTSGQTISNTKKH